MDDGQIRDEQEQIADETAGEDTEGHLLRGRYRDEGADQTPGNDSDADDPDVEGHRWRH